MANVEEGNQRWLARRASYRPPTERIRPAEYDVLELPDDARAKAFVVEHHYSASYPAARFRFGLYRRGELVGVAVYAHPCNDAVLTSVFGGRAIDSVVLARFVLVDSVPGNGETWFLARTFRRLRARGLRGVLSFSDPVPRTTVEGRRVFAGHIGTIYQASNASYLERTARSWMWILPDGRALPPRTIAKIRNLERGWQHASAILTSFGADPMKGDPRQWLERWLPLLTRRQRHDGNHRYAWSFARTELGRASLAYPCACSIGAPCRRHAR